MSPRYSDQQQGGRGGRSAGPDAAELRDLKAHVWEAVKQWGPQFDKVLPNHLNVTSWLASVVGALNRDTSGKLWAAAANDTDALLVALFRAAQMGLEPGTEQFYLTVRKSKILGVPGYQGEIEMIYRAGSAASVKVEVIRANDSFVWDPGAMDRPNHRADWLELKGERGDLVGVYAYAAMKDGATSQVVVLNRRDIAKIRDASDGADSGFSPWKTWEESMWKKSAVHQLRKWVPTSAEYLSGQRRAVAGAEHDVRGRAAIPTQFAAAADEYDDDTEPTTTPARPAPATPARGLPATPSETYPMPDGVTDYDVAPENDPTLQPGWGHR